jgi:hypothetical protein
LPEVGIIGKAAYQYAARSITTASSSCRMRRRSWLMINVRKHPTSAWIIQQLREAFPFEASRKYLIFGRDQKFGFEVIAAVKAARIIPKRTSFRSPWQNGIAERWVGSCRRDLRDLLDHMVALHGRHLKRLLLEYVRYHHEDRTHLELEKGTPEGRIRSEASGRVLSQERLGGAAPSLQSSGIVRIDFRPVLYICALHAHRARPLSVFLLYRVDNRIHAYSTRTTPFRASAKVLANNRAADRLACVARRSLTYVKKPGAGILKISVLNRGKRQLASQLNYS